MPLKPLIVPALLAGSIFAAVLASGAAQPGDQAALPQPDLARGEKLFYERCAACHNSTGKIGPRLEEHSAYFIQAGIPAEMLGLVLIPSVRQRPPGSIMPVFSQDEVSDADLMDIGYFFGHRYPAPTTPPPTGDATRGAELFAKNCQLCHGEGARGTQKVKPLAALAHELQAGGAPPAVMQALVLLACRSGEVPQMPKFDAASLDDQACADLAAYLWGSGAQQ